MSTAIPETKTVEYPESDGLPMAENTRQFQYIVTIQGGIDALFKDAPDVFVVGDNFWYPVEGHPEIRTAPDVYVVFGRPKGHRSSYRQWEEDGIAPQVVFEVLSPSNRPVEMLDKFDFYQEYGVEEYYVYDPDAGELRGWGRVGDALRPFDEMSGQVSRRLGVRFGLEGTDLVLYRPDGRRFATYVELAAQLESAEQRAERLASKLRQLGIDPNA